MWRVCLTGKDTRIDFAVTHTEAGYMTKSLTSLDSWFESKTRHLEVFCSTSFGAH